MPERLRRLLGTLLALWCTLAAAAAWAACAGVNLIESHRAEDPDGIAALFERAHAVPNAQGRFWRIERAGTAPSHLFGTFHAPAAVKFVPPEVWAALDASTTAIFEVSLEQQAELQQRIGTDPTFAYDYSAPPLSTRMTPEERRHFSKALAARGIPAANAQQMRPWLLASLLGFPACHFEAIAEGQPSLDVAMARRAEAAGIETAGLESYEAALAAIERIDLDVILTSFGNAGKLIEIEEDLFRTNTDLYAAGEIEALNEYAIWLADRIDPDTDNRRHSEEMMAEILEIRNRAWIAPLLGHLAKGNVFVAVGALHLPRESGLIELLRAEGYTLTRLDG